MSEERLKGLAEGDPEAIAWVYDTFAKGLYYHALTLLGSPQDAEDLLQNLIIALARTRPRVEGSLKTYLYRAVRHEAAAVLERRSIGNQKIKNRRAPAPSAPSPLEIQALREALAALPSEQREPVILKFFYSFTLREIAELTGDNADTIASRCRYAMEKLKEMFHVA